MPLVSEARELAKILKHRENEKKKSHEFVTSERSMKINKDNQILLSKLVEI